MAADPWVTVANNSSMIDMAAFTSVTAMFRDVVDLGEAARHRR
jgi:hypothetical protein